MVRFIQSTTSRGFLSPAFCMAALLLVSAMARAQNSDVWTAFTNQKQDLIGYKDSRGQVKIPPKFSSVLTSAQRFEHIIAVSEQTAQGYQTYYLLKDGQHVGEGSLYLFDVTPDCESEGKIRFRDKQRGQVGYFDSYGKVAIPAVFSAAGPFRNGVAWALRGAETVCADSGAGQCEHWSLVGGQRQLIGADGQVLVDGFAVDDPDTLDWYSLLVSAVPTDDPRRVSFKGVDGRYYSFVDVEKDFAIWFKDSFLPHLDKTSLQARRYKQIWRWGSHGWASTPGRTTVAKNEVALRSTLMRLRQSGEYEVRQQLPFLFDADTQPALFDGCGNFASWKTPLLSAAENLNSGSHEPAKHASFDFIRTRDGYRLYSYSLPGGRQKH